MSQYFESIKYQNGTFFNLAYHQERVNRTLHYLSEPGCLDLSKLRTLPPQDDRLYKCRVVYDGNHHNCQWIPYEKRIIKNLLLVHADSMEYTYKSVDRSAIDNLTHGIDPNSDIIICINGVIKDSSYSNLAFLRKNIWYTPDIPLLRGTRRQKLLDTKKLVPMEILVNSLKEFERVSLINAMLDLNEMEITIEHVH